MCVCVHRTGHTLVLSTVFVEQFEGRFSLLYLFIGPSIVFPPLLRPLYLTSTFLSLTLPSLSLTLTRP